MLLELEKPGPMTQAELASRSRVSPTIINRMVKNHARQVSLATLGKLAGVLGCEQGETIAGPPGRRHRG